MMNILKHWIPYDDKSHRWPQILSICCACLSGLTMGTQLTWTSPAVPILTSNASHIEPISLEEASYFTIISPSVSIICGPLFAFITGVTGRKIAVMLIGIPYILSWFLIAVAENLPTLYIARCISGIGDAGIFTTLPMYIGEIATPRVRGVWGNLVPISINVGVLTVNVVGAFWDVRETAYILICIPTIHLLIAGFLPESPYFLLMKDRHEEARDSLRKLRWQEDVSDELASINKDVQRQISERGTLKDLFLIPTNRKALLVSIGIRSAQQLSGLTALSFYTQYLFNQAGSDLSASTSAIIFAAVLAVTNFAVLMFGADRFGRRPMLLFSSFGCGVMTAVEAVYFFIYEQTSLDTSRFTWVPLAGLSVYLLMSSAGLCILPTLMLGELFSANIKANALCVSNIFYCFCLLSLSKVFQLLFSNFGMYVPFLLFSLCCFTSILFCYYFVPETKGKTLEEIQQSLRGKRVKKEVSI